MKIAWRASILIVGLLGALGGVSAQAPDFDPNGTLTLATNADPTLNP